MSNGLTVMMSCYAFDCKFNKDDDCMLKEISVSETGECLLKDFIKSGVHHFVDFRFIDTNPDLFDETQLKTSEGKWIFVYFQHIKNGVIFRLLKNGTPVEINGMVEFEAKGDAFQTTPGNYRVEVVRNG